MSGYSLSPLEVSRIIEEAFLPERCVCSSPDGKTLSIQVVPLDYPEKARTFAGIPLEQLNSSRAISQLIVELREELLEGSNLTEGAQTKRLG